MRSTCGEVVQKELFWQGDITASMSLNLGGLLLTALNDCDELTVNFEEVDFLDFSCLALLCAVKRQANEKGKGLQLEGLEHPPVAAVVQRLQRRGNRLCRTYCGNNCLFDPEN